jgi:cell wall-associated NlpC family hydrolase
MSGKLVRYLVEEGAPVAAGTPYVEVEVMKMYMTLTVPEAGRLRPAKPEGSMLEPGDLISFHGSGHIGIYIGGGQYVHAPQTGDVVKVSSLADRSDMDGAVRIG